MPEFKNLRRAVLAALVADPQVGTGYIRVSTAAGAVTLSGYVSSHGQRDAACRAARRVVGVHDVINAVHIAVPARPEIRANLG